MSESAIASAISNDNHSASPTQLSTRNYDEKRDFIRMRVNTEAVVINAAGDEIVGYCHNLSGGGALLEMAQALELNEEIEVIIHSQYGHAPVFSSKGAVVRNQAIQAKNNYLVAVKY